MLDAWDCPPPEKFEHRVPGVRRRIGEPHHDAVSERGRRIHRPRLPQLERRTREQLFERLVEAADAAESRRVRDQGHWQPGVLNQLLGQKDAAGLHDGMRRCAEMPGKQPPQLACTHPQSFGEVLNAALLEGAVVDQAQGPGDGG